MKALVQAFPQFFVWREGIKLPYSIIIILLLLVVAGQRKIDYELLKYGLFCFLHC